MGLKKPYDTYEEFEDHILEGMGREIGQTLEEMRIQMPKGLAWCRPFLKCLFEEIKGLREKGGQ